MSRKGKHMKTKRQEYRGVMNMKKDYFRIMI